MVMIGKVQGCVVPARRIKIIPVAGATPRQGGRHRGAPLAPAAKHRQLGGLESLGILDLKQRLAPGGFLVQMLPSIRGVPSNFDPI